MPELNILRQKATLKIWQNNLAKIIFKENDYKSLFECIRNVLYGYGNECSFIREVYGAFRIVRVGNNFNLYGEKGHFECTEKDVSRLLAYVQPILQPAPKRQDNLTLEDLENTDVLIISNENDVKEAIKIKDKLFNDFHHSAIICDDDKWTEWHKIDSIILINKPQLSIGGPKYNDTTEYLKDNSTKYFLSSFTDYSIKIGEKDLIIYGHENPEQTVKATDNFLNSRMLDYYVYCFRKYLGILDNNKQVKSDDPLNQTPETHEVPVAAEDSKLKIEEFHQICPIIDKKNKAEAKFILFHATDKSKNKTIDFNKVSDYQFSFLLFLIFERIDGKSNWVVRSFEDLNTFSRFKRVCEICGHSSEPNAAKGWWADSGNHRKKGYVKSIKKKLEDKGISGDLILKQKRKGSYSLNPCLIASIEPRKL